MPTNGPIPNEGYLLKHRFCIRNNRSGDAPTLTSLKPSEVYLLPIKKMSTAKSPHYQQLSDSIRELGFSTYKGYCSSPLWREIRRRAFAEKGRECVCCNSTAKVIHHRNYKPETMSGKSIKALVPLCGRCHFDVEHKSDGTKEMDGDAIDAKFLALKKLKRNSNRRNGRKQTKDSRGEDCPIHRNCAFFGDIRKISYRIVMRFKKANLGFDECSEEILKTANEINSEPCYGLPQWEVACTVRSVSAWAWKKFSPEKFSELQRARVLKRWASKTPAGKPWIEMGVSRSTYYQRKKLGILPGQIR